METAIVIAIIAVCAVYVARNFYRKFLVGKSKNDSCGCSGCAGTPQEGCDLDVIGSEPPDSCPTNKST